MTTTDRAAAVTFSEPTPAGIVSVSYKGKCVGTAAPSPDGRVSFYSVRLFRVEGAHVDVPTLDDVTALVSLYTPVLRRSTSKKAEAAYMSTDPFEEADPPQTFHRQMTAAEAFELEEEGRVWGPHEAWAVSEDNRAYCL